MNEDIKFVIKIALFVIGFIVFALLITVNNSKSEQYATDCSKFCHSINLEYEKSYHISDNCICRPLEPYTYRLRKNG